MQTGKTAASAGTLKHLWANVKPATVEPRAPVVVEADSPGTTTVTPIVEGPETRHPLAAAQNQTETPSSAVTDEPSPGAGASASPWRAAVADVASVPAEPLGTPPALPEVVIEIAQPASAESVGADQATEGNPTLHAVTASEPAAALPAPADGTGAAKRKKGAKGGKAEPTAKKPKAADESKHYQPQLAAAYDKFTAEKEKRKFVRRCTAQASHLLPVRSTVLNRAIPASQVGPRGCRTKVAPGTVCEGLVVRHPQPLDERNPS